MSIEIQYIAHSAFYVRSADKSFLIDPFISQNPMANFSWEDKPVDAIFVTHGHADHLGDAISISKSKNVPIVAVFELANYCESKGAKAIPVSIGGKISIAGIQARFLNAIHSSSTFDETYAGSASSILFELDGKRIYHAGDTALNYDMKIVGEFYKPDVAMLPVGGHFTMGIEEASVAAKWTEAKLTVPMHYNTFPPIKIDINDFEKVMQSKNLNYKVLSPNEILTI